MLIFIQHKESSSSVHYSFLTLFCFLIFFIVVILTPLQFAVIFVACFTGLPNHTFPQQYILSDVSLNKLFCSFGDETLEI
jgi:hypothetical protein